MCKYRYESKGQFINGRTCIYPQFYSLHRKDFPYTKTLPVDCNGYCIFHSQDYAWKEENGFNAIFLELFDVISLVNKDISSLEWMYNFIGFIFIDKLTLKDIHRKNSIDFSGSKFLKGFTLSKSHFSSIDLTNSVFFDILILEDISSDFNIYSSNSVFEMGILFKGCEIKGNLYFDNCKFNYFNKTQRCEIAIVKCPEIYSISFESSTFYPLVSVQKSTIKQELKFDKAIIYNEFIFSENTLDGMASFRETEFLLSENFSPEYSSVNFINNIINETGKIIFKGKFPMADMVKGELSIYFNTSPMGLISFENFDLNKLYLKDKLKLLELEKINSSIVSIASSCRKYSCMTPIFVVEATETNQIFILDLINVFCNYFKIKDSSNIGIEIVKKTAIEICYYYFTDEQIEEEAFLQKIKRNEIGIWETLSNLTEIAREAISSKNTDLIFCLLKLETWWKMIGYSVINKQIDLKGFSNAVNSISINKREEQEIKEIFTQIFSDYNFTLTNRQFTVNVINMRDTFNISGGVNNFSINNNEISQIAKENKLSEEQKNELLVIIEKVQKEPIEKKEDKLKELFKDWLPTIASVISEAIKPFV